MDIHECMKCRYYLTHFDDNIICVRHEDKDDIQSLIVTVKKNSKENSCPLFAAQQDSLS
ncbi:MAG: hypothetical protein BWY23_02294 [Spirochaetes bacterium ADurb.Bin218]|jgi:hypothetical protein|nr:hypothetical protein [Spirochaetota bacterium]OQA95760.1 MAG: hypothetical protein BWY23_02294 [Spirochaetes bacterium ADurb.Bin218]HOQ11455.1 hypothetical protein [Spirochaetota bacterium]HOV09885.1 hypothetical protein [Spirochaetota bacterium]HPX91127.1 hypothetical protein [Spirochaetota bacterium]